MSLDPGESSGAVWTRWQGHVINGVFPLGRLLGSSDHSGVFLTRSAVRRPAEVAIKLVPTNRAEAELLLPRWRRAGRLIHPHLLRLWEWGGCQLEGVPHLYTIMEYADQTLAGLLQHRALSETEAREMLPPILETLVFLHGRELLQGQLKPANILVVGEQLKLASDTIRPLIGAGPQAPSVFDAPEARSGSRCAASDIWGLGVTLTEALTRRVPEGLDEPGAAAVLPPELPAAFRDTVARCLSVNSQDRPTPTQLLAWAGVPPSAPTAAAPPIADAVPTPAPTATAPIAPGALRTAPSRARLSKPRLGPVAMLAAAAAVFVLGWMVVRAFRTDRSLPHPAPPMQAAAALPSQAPAAEAAPSPRAAVPVAAIKAGSADSVLHEEIPDVPRSARRTIHGHLKVWVRVIVQPDGSVSAAAADLPGPSKYFRRLAIEAAEKWTFPTVDAPSTRLMQVRFDFSRDATTGRAIPLH